MDKWIVDDTHAVEPTPGGDVDASYLLKLSRGDRRARSLVEFAAPSTLTSIGYAREALARYLGDENPPERVIVGRDGQVSPASSTG
jgi:hypothetical protein